MDIIIFFLILVASLVITLNLFAIYWFGSMLIPVFAGGAPYVPTHPEILKRMLALAQITSNDVVVDLGSGDGRLVIAAARAGARQSIGYEIHPGLVRFSNWKIKQSGLENSAIVKNESMWKADLSQTNLVFLYQIPYAMGRIKRLLERDLAPGSRIISHAFNIPGWEPDEANGNVLLYIIKNRV
ncbi:50S ribosomal protein L11 methyltransferase [Candidatus Uhrbacteria bacterium]|nr:50S ribosomal protein L11 methyltransferase [Candidatus Uhrbacteria bacterium]